MPCSLNGGGGGYGVMEVSVLQWHGRAHPPGNANWCRPAHAVGFESQNWTGLTGGCTLCQVGIRVEEAKHVDGVRSSERD